MSSLGDVIFGSVRAAYGLPNQTEDTVTKENTVTNYHAADESSDKVVVVTVKNIYGRQTIYPVCWRAKIFAQIAGDKTLTPQTVGLIKDLGYQINVNQPQVSL